MVLIHCINGIHEFASPFSFFDSSYVRYEWQFLKMSLTELIRDYRDYISDIYSLIRWLDINRRICSRFIEETFMQLT